MDAAIVIEAENYVGSLATAIILPRPGECLPCYLDRVMHDVRCDHSLRLARIYRDALAPRATALERRLQDGGGYCDCEVLMNVYWAKSDTVKPCRRVGRGSTKPCALWVRHRVGDPWS